MRKKDRAVLVHGIWMSGLEMSLLQQRIRACGFDCHRFHYSSLKLTPAQSAAELHGFLQHLGTGTIHLVAHSLGGIVLLHLFSRFPQQQPGRVVMLGTPVRGSAVAGRLARGGVLRKVLGRSTEAGLLGDVPEWTGGRELGIIAGTQALGLGRLVGGLEQPSDGTVAVVETRLRGASAYLPLRVSHTGLLFSRRTAQATCRFLRTGSFDIT
jgi:pimeloyl-ACP methyl ester carboxylesterase